MARQGLSLGRIAIGCRVKDPDLHEVIATSRHEASVARGPGARGTRHDGARRRGRSPGHGVDAEAVGGESTVVEVVVLELEDRDVAVRGRAGQQAARLVGRPRDDVDRGLVQRKVEDLLPRALLLAPDEDLAVVAGRGENVAVFGVCPGYAPDRALVPDVSRVLLSAILSLKNSFCFFWSPTLSMFPPIAGSLPRFRRS